MRRWLRVKHNCSEASSEHRAASAGRVHGGLEWSVRTPHNDPSAFVKIVFGSDSNLDDVESVVNQYRAMFDAWDVPERAHKMTMGGTLSKMLGLPH